MLVLTRRAEESIWIGEEIQIQIVAVGGGKVHMGIRAPREIAVVRSELLDSPNANLDGKGLIVERTD